MSSMYSRTTAHPSNLIQRIERIGDKLPHPFYLFIYLCAVIMVLSALVAAAGSSVTHPGNGSEVAVRSLLSGEGLVYILSSTVDNFISFKPLGLVLCMMLAVGLMQEVGLADAAIKASLLNAPRQFVTGTIFLVGIIGNLASDAAFILVPPLAGIVFAATNRNPIVGIAAGFVAVAAGFTANIFIAGTDVLLSGITTEAAAIVRETEVSPAANWYFMLISVPLLVVVSTLITDKYIEPRFSSLHSREGVSIGQDYGVSAKDKVALKWTLAAAATYLGIFLLILLPTDSPLRNAEGGLVPSPFLSGIIPVIMGFFIFCAVVFGTKSGAIQRADDVPRLMAKSLKTVGSYIVLVFVIAQFIAWFNWSNLAIFIAVNGAEWLSDLPLPNLVMLALFMVLAGAMNLIVFSGSAQWAIMAPVFIPLFMLLGVDPANTQMAYRIADTTTNIISPTNPYIPMVLALIARYNPEVRFGTFLAMMLPYALILFSAWGASFLLYFLLGLPVGPM
ncbi:AbgT family transporter [Oceanimonas baumannii]|uniref:Aminobenzoyl-glutamate transport protein n=1 Tax=Oceanimonas baumannii TaxID=129578 RepID=A0A235CGZ5_9GAMM|nr:AbgT family transporter [Oceanimonas baumannii]OYD23654.1 p-aminobenzoyl-glutamate transporter [Oceanimonas baumannii]TDW55849.1 aminobenzoyl-glutamate transport protein [Oceanimonas baumannii]